MKIVHIPHDNPSGSPDSPEWLAWRKEGLGSSDSIFIAHEKHLIPADPKPSWIKPLAWLVRVKQGVERADGDTWATIRGKHGESIARALYEQQTGNVVAPIFGEMDEYPFIRASFDAMTLCGGTIVEIKCPGAAAHAYAMLGTVPSYYLPQLAHQGLVAWGEPDTWPQDAEFHYVSCVPETREAVIVRVPAPQLQALAGKLLRELIAFWAVVRGESSLHGEDYARLAQAYLAAERVVEKAKETLEERRKALERFLLESGRDKIVGEGLNISFVEKRGAIDYDAALRDLGVGADALEQFRKPMQRIFSIRKEKLKPAIDAATSREAAA